MDLVKMGKFLQELRREKGLTQERLAEQLGVARRTVSRWETGSNLPDLDVLIELSDYYGVDLREILSGERRSEPMDQELKETVLQVADYSNEGKARLLRRIRGRTLRLLISALLLAVVCLWRFWPHSFSQMVPQAEPKLLNELQASAVFMNTDENGNLKSDSYTAVFSTGDEGWSEILWLLHSANYRKDFRNPFLPLLNGAATGKNDDKTIQITLKWGTEANQCCYLSLHSKSLYIAYGDRSLERICHATDRALQDKVADYIRKNGEKK